MIDALSDRRTEVDEMVEMPAPSLLCVDGHVHLHPCFDLARLFDAAVDHARLAAEGDERVRPDRILLCVADDATGARFAALPKETGPGTSRSWRLESAGEPGALLARRSDGAEVCLVEGRQLRTAEGLEVLALATAPSPAPRGDLAATVRDVLDAGGVPVIAWGFGKWWFRRGRGLRAFLASELADRAYLGDSAGRLAVGPHLGMLRLARRRGVSVLPGTDPPPSPGAERRIGRYGFLVPDFPLDNRPAERLRSDLHARSVQPPSYGRRVPAARALLAQIQLFVRRYARPPEGERGS